MKITRRPFRGDADLASMTALAAASPEVNLHVVDLPYRLASWALDDPENVALWVDGGGRLVAWAALQFPFSAVDIGVRPDVEALLVPEALEWVDDQVRVARSTPREKASWYIHAFADQEKRLRLFEEAGYVSQADVGEDSWSRVLLRRTGPVPAPAPLEPGFAVRPLAGKAEVDAYVELQRVVFGTKNMTAEWRARTLDAAHHVAEADLVAVAPDGRLAGFCIGWLLPGEHPVGQIEPLGVLWDYRELGLGAALLGNCLQHLVARGATTQLVETDTYRTPALGLYESVGFEPIRDVLVYRKDYPSG